MGCGYVGEGETRPQAKACVEDTSRASRRMISGWQHYPVATGPVRQSVGSGDSSPGREKALETASAVAPTYLQLILPCRAR